MLIEKFDAYGEVLPDAGGDQPEAATAVSGVLGHVGQYVFWLLVVISFRPGHLLSGGPAFEFALQPRSSGHAPYTCGPIRRPRPNCISRALRDETSFFRAFRN